MLELWRLVQFATRTFLGLIVLALIAYGALWLFVRGASLVPGKGNPDDALKRVQSYNNAIVTERMRRSNSSKVTEDCSRRHDPACDSRPRAGSASP